MPDQVIIFRDAVRILMGPLNQIWDAAHHERNYNPTGLTVFDAVTGKVMDLPLSRPDDAAQIKSSPETETAPRRRGRPKLGVSAKEVTLLPRHWEWLSAQRGGASATLRRLVDEARKAEADVGQTKRQQTAAYNFMSEMAGNLPGYEEALRCLYRNDREGFLDQVRKWPSDIRQTATDFAFGSSERPKMPGPAK